LPPGRGRYKTGVLWNVEHGNKFWAPQNTKHSSILVTDTPLSMEFGDKNTKHLECIHSIESP
jgi:hypothetical protein